MIKTVEILPHRGTQSHFNKIFVDFFEKKFFANLGTFQLENIFRSKNIKRIEYDQNG